MSARPAQIRGYRQKRILAYLRGAKRPLSTTAIVDSEYPLSRATILKYLKELEHDGSVRRWSRTEWVAAP